MSGRVVARAGKGDLVSRPGMLYIDACGSGQRFVDCRGR